MFPRVPPSPARWLFLFALILGSCTTYERHFADLKPRDAARIAPYAMMAANVYDHDGKGFPLDKLGWKLDRSGDAPRFHRFSLVYDVFRNDRRREYAFVFRGTDSYLDFLWANLALGTSWQYSYADGKFRHFLDRRPPRYRDYHVVLVGHSLGGGMSLRESVKYGYDAFVFNPSPRIFGPPVPQYATARRDVVFEKGEALIPLRERTSAWYLATKRGDGTVYEVNYYFGKEANNAHGFSKMVKLHSMPKLAQGVVNTAALSDSRLRASAFHLDPEVR